MDVLNLSLDSNAPDSKIALDGDKPTSPVLSGTPIYNGDLAVLFNVEQADVGFVWSEYLVRSTSSR